jgi:cytoskeletal protein CcmA (bactofilin family)
MRVGGSARVDGRVRGSVIVEGDLEVGPSGHIEGEQVRANNILIHGRISAQVMASGKLVLTKQGQLEGDVRAIALDIEAGAVFVGRSQTGEPKALPKSS